MDREGYRTVKKALKDGGVRARLSPRLGRHDVTEYVSIRCSGPPDPIFNALGRMGLIAEPDVFGDFVPNHARPALDVVPTGHPGWLLFKDVNFE